MEDISYREANIKRENESKIMILSIESQNIVEIQTDNGKLLK